MRRIFEFELDEQINILINELGFVRDQSIELNHFNFSGGGYFRLCPYPLIKKWSKESSDYMMAYIHPRDLDAGQPMLEGLPAARM